MRYMFPGWNCTLEDVELALKPPPLDGSSELKPGLSPCVIDRVKDLSEDEGDEREGCSKPFGDEGEGLGWKTLGTRGVGIQTELE